MLQEKLNQLKVEVDEKVNAATTSQELAEIRNDYLSKKAALVDFLMNLCFNYNTKNSFCQNIFLLTLK